MQAKAGFTLIELMVVVAIVAILAAVAVPSYQTFVQDGRRAEGVALALDVASRQERYYTQNSSYTSNLTTSLGMASATSENGYYTASVTDSGSGTGDNLANYVITVAPSVTDSECGSLSLTNVGVRSVSVASADAAECWR